MAGWPHFLIYYLSLALRCSRIAHGQRVEERRTALEIPRLMQFFHFFGISSNARFVICCVSCVHMSKIHNSRLLFVTREGGASNTYRDRLKGMQILLSRTQPEPGRKGKQEQEQTSRNHVQAF